MSDVVEVSLDDSKYVFILGPESTQFLRCLRHGEEWRGFCGDNAVHALFAEVVRLRKQLEDRGNAPGENGVFGDLLAVAEDLKFAGQALLVSSVESATESSAYLKRGVNRYDEFVSTHALGGSQGAVGPVEGIKYSLMDAGRLLCATWPGGELYAIGSHRVGGDGVRNPLDKTSIVAVRLGNTILYTPEALSSSDIPEELRHEHPRGYASFPQAFNTLSKRVKEKEND